MINNESPRNQIFHTEIKSFIQECDYSIWKIYNNNLWIVLILLIGWLLDFKQTVFYNSHGSIWSNKIQRTCLQFNIVRRLNPTRIDCIIRRVSSICSWLFYGKEDANETL